MDLGWEKNKTAIFTGQLVNLKCRFQKSLSVNKSKIRWFVLTDKIMNSCIYIDHNLLNTPIQCDMPEITKVPVSNKDVA